MAVPPIQYRATDYPPQYRPVGYWRHARRRAEAPTAAPTPARASPAGGRCSPSLLATLVLHAGIAVGVSRRRLGEHGEVVVRATADEGREVRRAGRSRDPTATVAADGRRRTTPDPGAGRPGPAAAPPTRDRRRRQQQRSAVVADIDLGPEEVSTLLERTLFEAKRVLVGQDRMLERMMVCLLAARALPARRRARPGQDARGRDARTRGARVVRAHPVHARPRAVRHRRLDDLQEPTRDVRRRARPRVRELRARRRDQPRAGEGAVGAARGDVATAGHDQRDHVSRAGAVLRARDAEPDRVGGRVPAARGAARPVPPEDPRAVPEPDRGARDHQPHGRRPAARRRP